MTQFYPKPMIQEKVRDSRVSSLIRTASLLSEHKDDLVHYLGQDPKGKQVPGFVIMLADRLEVERQSVLGELIGLIQGVSHIQEIVRTQQSYAGSYSIIDRMKPEEVVEDALRMSGASLVRHGVKVQREFADLPSLLLDKHKVLQILLNLMSNAKCAMDTMPEEDRVMTLRTHGTGEVVLISVADRGVGVGPQV